jgi:hypothetical protein
MPRYAIVVTSDEKYLPGVNGQLNAMRYYGMEADGVEYHLIHTFPKDGYIERAKAEFPCLVATTVDDYMMGSGRWRVPGKKSKSVMKYVRWWYPVDMLADYDAICILDADRQIVNNFTRHLWMIGLSDMIGLAKNDWSEGEWWSYDQKRAMQANPPLYSNPYFITGRRAKELFPLMPEYAENPKKYAPWYGREQTGDMHPVNLTLLQTGMIDHLFPLEASQWVFVETTHVMLRKREIRGKFYIGIHEAGDLLYTFHRKFWGQRTCQRFMNGHGPLTRVNGVNNTYLFWWFTHFFNTQLYLKIDWIYGDFPGQKLSAAAEGWLARYIERAVLNHKGEEITGAVYTELAPLLNKAGNMAELKAEALNTLRDLGVPVLRALAQRY